MIVYRGPRVAFGGGVRSRAGFGTLPPAPNNTVNRLVCPASVASLPCCPGSPSPETTIAWASPGPVIRAWDGPFASAGVASVIAVAMLIPAARAVRTISLRSMGRLLPLRFTLATPPPGDRFPRASRLSASRAGDGERSCLAEIAFQAERDLPGAPDQGVAGGEPGRGCGWRAVAGDVHQYMRALDPQAFGAVHLDFGHVAEVNELLEEDWVEVAGELIHPQLSVRRPAVDQGRDPPAIADRNFAWPAERRRYQEGEGGLVAGLLQRHPPLAGQGSTTSRGAHGAWLLAKLNAGEPEHADDHRTPLRGCGQDSQECQHHNQRGTPSQPVPEDTGPQGRPVAAPDWLPFEPLPHDCGEVAGWRHLKFAARGPQLGLQCSLPPGPVSHGRPGSALRARSARGACSGHAMCATSPIRAATPALAPSPPRTGRGSSGTPAPAVPCPGARSQPPLAGPAVPRPALHRQGRPPPCRPIRWRTAARPAQHAGVANG